MLATISAHSEASNLELSDLALEAAIAIENSMAGRSDDAEALSRFVERITESIVSKDGNAKLVDVTLTPIYNRALSSTLHRNFEDTQSLLETLSRVISDSALESEKALSSPEKMRDFCLAMHSSLLNRTVGSSSRVQGFDVP